MDKIAENVFVFNLSNYVQPKPKVNNSKDWVLFGDKHEFYQYIIDRKQGSPTNESVLNVCSRLLYGRGIVLNGQSDNLYEPLYDIFSKQDIKNSLDDRKTFGMSVLQIQRARGGGIAKITHLPMNNVAMGKAEDGDINSVFYCEDWRNPRKFTPQEIPVFKGELNEPVMALVIRRYVAGHFYYATPDYMASLQYAELEEEIANWSVNHIKNGLSFGHILNVNGAAGWSDEKKGKYINSVREKYSGSSNSGKLIVSFNSDKESESTFSALEVNNASQQYEFWAELAQKMIVRSHGGYTDLFGIKEGAGLASNADELDVQSRLMQDYQTQPIQEEWLDAIKPLLELQGLETDLVFLPIRETYKSTENTTETVKDETVEVEAENIEKDAIELSSDDLGRWADTLISLGETPDKNNWDVVEMRNVETHTISEKDLNTVFKFASTPPSGKSKTSTQDTSLFKVRYTYAGDQNPERVFCKKLVKASNNGRVWRAEDLQAALPYNPGFGIAGSDIYNVFLYKGGVNCKHFWQRVIFLKKGNKQISVNEARRMILELDPEDRPEARWDENPPEVAQSASIFNNYWRVT